VKKFSTSFTVELPQWACELAEQLPECIESREDRMRLVHELADKNIINNTGGPFAAAVFESASGKVVSIGVNRVMPHNCSSAHGEVVALSLAQARLGTFDLGRSDLPEHELVVNWLPCTMCYGAVIWSGVKRLVIAGNGPELEEITGFDEGPRPEDWEQQLNNRGIAVINNVLRDEALTTFKRFRDMNKYVYNARK
jgi:tRNA(Arg) A34 adenosine deaminase TadA